MNKKRMAIMLGATGVVFGGVFGFVAFKNMMIANYFANMPQPVISVTAEPAVVEEWRDVVPAVGTLAAVNGVDVSASVAGLVREIAFESGQPVKKGEVLLRLDSDVEMGELRSAQAQADLAKTTLDRQRSLVRTDAVSRAALDKAEAEYKVAQAKVAQLKAAIDKRSVLAPFDGVLGVRRVDLGQFLQAGQTIVNLQDLSVMLADFSVSQKDLGAVTPGQKLRMSTDAWPGRAFEGTVQAVEPQVDLKTGMIGVQGRFPNGDGALRPGMFARIEVARANVARVVTVPVSAVTYNLHGNAVFVVKDGTDGGKVAERAIVEVGERREGRIAVRSGVNAGDVVVTSGQVKLESGAKVQVDEANPLKQAKAQ